MEGSAASPDLFGFGWRLLATLFFVLMNGFFVAAEFALVKIEPTAVERLVADGSSRAGVVRHILAHLDRYLSACQLGITVASLVLGWLAEPAIAALLLVGLAPLGFPLAAQDPLLHAASLAIALTLVTMLHMTLGEQAPKIWAIRRAETTALRVAIPLRLFTLVFQPFIRVINGLSNSMLRLGGISSAELSEVSAHDPEDLKRILAASAAGGHITGRQLELVQNVLDIMGLEVRHIMVPRIDVEFLSVQSPLEENLRILRSSGHSRFPLCAVGLDTVMGIVHAKEVLATVAEGKLPDLKALSRKPLFVSDTQPVSRLIVQLQRTRNHCCVVLDEHGTSIGLAFLEDAIEEIVGPIQDEFDEASPEIQRLGSGVLEVPGALALPEAADELDLRELTEEADTIGGYVVALLGRLPRKGDRLRIADYDVTVISVARRRVERLRFEPRASEAGEASAG